MPRASQPGSRPRRAGRRGSTHTTPADRPGRAGAGGWPTGVTGEEMAAQLGRVLVEVARHTATTASTGGSGGSAEPGPGIRARQVNGQPARGRGELARLSASIERERRIEAGRRARRLPYLATAATAVAGYTSWGAAELADAALGPAVHTGAVTVTAGLCALGVGATRVAFRHGITQSWAHRWWTAAAAASGWVTLAAATGPDTWSMTAALALGASAVSSRWLREHAVPEVADMPAVAPLPSDEADPAEDVGDVLAQRWVAHVARKGGPVPAALLSERRDLPNAIEWTVQLPPGDAAFDRLLAQRARIASGLRVGQSKIIVEPVVDDESTARLIVVTRDVLADGVPYPGPAYLGEGMRDGRIPIGPFADGTGQADYVAVDGVGCRNGLATGAPGSGKSAFLEIVTLGHLTSGCWVPLFADGDPGGGSSPLLNRVAHWAAAGPEQVLAQLEAIEAELEVRTALKATLTPGPDGTPVPITDPTTELPVREMLPCPAYPGILWVLDELHRLTTDDWLKSQKFAQRLEKIARIGRKYGIVMLAGTQSLLIADFGGAEVGSRLRGYLAARNNFAFYNPNKTEQHVVGGLRIAPSTLPTGGGYAFSTGAGRLAMLRVAWAPDLSPWATQLPTVSPDPDTARVLDRYRPADAGDPTALYASAADRLRALRNGQAPEPSAPPPGPAAPPPPTASTSASTTAASGQAGSPGGSLIGGIRVPTALGAANVITLPTRTTSPTRTTPSALAGRTTRAPDPAVLSSLTGTQRAVFDALASLGVRQLARTGQLVDLTDLPAPAVSKALTALQARGLARKLAHGAWTTTEHARSDTTDLAEDDDTNEEETG